MVPASILNVGTANGTQIGEDDAFKHVAKIDFAATRKMMNASGYFRALALGSFLSPAAHHSAFPNGNPTGGTCCSCPDLGTQQHVLWECPHNKPMARPPDNPLAVRFGWFDSLADTLRNQLYYSHVTSTVYRILKARHEDDEADS